MTSRTFDIDAGDSLLRLDTIHYSSDGGDDTKKPPDAGPRPPRLVVQSITSSEFEPFSHFFVIIGKTFHLTGCAMHSLFLKIRTVPSVPVIETSPVWCIDSEVDFRAGYALDFTSVPSFSLGEYTPVIEFYRRQSSSPELFAFAILPLKVKEVVQCAGQTLTYLYKNEPVELRQFTSGQVIGTMNVIVALGFPQHQQFLDPNRELPTNKQVVAEPEPEPKPQAVKPKASPPRRGGFNLDVSDDTEEAEDGHRRRKRKSKRRRDRKRKNLWIQKATAYGWKPPGYVDPDWRDRARERGWKPPDTTVRSSIGVECDPAECRNLKDTVIQTDPPAPASVSSSFVSTKSSSAGNLSQSEDDVFALIDVLNKNNKAKKKAMCGFQPAECVFSMTGMENMRMTPVLTLMDIEGRCEVAVSSDDDEDDLDLQQSLHEIVAQSMSSHGLNIDLSDSDEDEPVSSSIAPLKDLDKFLKETIGSSDDEEEEDGADALPNPEHVMMQHLSSDSDDDSDDSSDAGFMVDHLLSRIEGGRYGDKELEALMNVYRS